MKLYASSFIRVTNGSTVMRYWRWNSWESVCY